MIEGKKITIPSRTIVEYNWFDIEKVICNLMGITKTEFRDYHKVVGGDYKDLWHVALGTVIGDEMHNDSTVRMWNIDLEDMLEDQEKWTHEFFKAYHQVLNELDPDDNGINVHFSW